MSEPEKPTIASVEADMQELQRTAARQDGATIGDWISGRMKAAAERGLGPTNPERAVEVVQADEQLARQLIGLLVGTLAAQSPTNVKLIAPYLARHRTASEARVQEGEADALIDGLAERIESVVEFSGYGCWTTCTGCYESEDGHPNGDYPHSQVLNCTLGGGCSECGGIGAVWDNTDYEDVARSMLAEDAAALPATAPSEGMVERVARAIADPGKYLGFRSEEGMTRWQARAAIAAIVPEGGEG
jgi:hypothetical protein